MLVDGFEHAAKSHPERTAIEDRDGRRITYRELDVAASRVADRLRKSGVSRGDRVGIYFAKSVESVVAILGALKARAAYVPLDAGAPAERCRHILGDCEAKVVCTTESGAAKLGELRATALVLKPMSADPAWLEGTEPEWRAPESASADDLSYILYTSGSTGRPKGVMHTQASAESFVDWAFRTVAPSGEDRFSSHAPFHFDLSIFDLYVCFRAGGTLILVDESLGARPLDLAAYMAERGITIWYSVPSILALLAEHGKLEQHDLSRLRTVVFAGEVFPIRSLKRLQQLLPGRAYFNFYGPTETNVCTAYRLPGPIPESQTTPVPIGPACDNVRARVLDDERREVESGQEGLLYVHASGPTMLGYWPPQPPGESTAFFRDAAGERWYNTGDLVREDADGNYVYLGRKDRMVKRRGYRIELGEIENALGQHDGVREVAAVAADSGPGLEIVAFLALADPAARLSIIALKQFCMSRLPGYMCPDRFEFLPALPRTANDKVDLQSLARLAPRPSVSG
jgi:amino acid adenylation domain-containing protein